MNAKSISPTLQLDPNQMKALASICATALNYRLLGFDASFDSEGRLKKIKAAGAQRKFAALLVCESFGIGQEWGQLDAMAFHRILAHGDSSSIWRVGFIHKLMAEFVKNGWMVTDGTGKFRLLPDRWPNWAEVIGLMRSRDHSRLDFVADKDLNHMLANISQANAAQCDFFATSVSPLISRCESFAPPPKPKPPDLPPAPPPGPENPSRRGGVLRSLRSEKFAAISSEPLRQPGGIPASLSSLKEKHKGIKPLQDFEALSDALYVVETGDEESAYTAMVGILGGVVMEGGDLDRHGQVRYGDGGKWRNWWRTNRRRTWRVLCALVEEIKEGTVKSRGARGNDLMREFMEGNTPHGAQCGC